MIYYLKEKFLDVRFMKYVIAGFINLAVHMSVAYVLDLKLHYQVSNWIAFYIGNISSYFLSTFWVFRKNFNIKALAMYPVTAIPAIILQSIILYVLVQLLGIIPLYARLFGIAVSVPLNYMVVGLFLNKVK